MADALGKNTLLWKAHGSIFLLGGVLLLDDPTSTLDPVGKVAFEDVSGPLRRDYTVLIATNDLSQAARLSDATCYLASGEIIESGETPLVFSRPTDVRAEAFLAGKAP